MTTTFLPTPTASDLAEHQNLVLTPQLNKLLLAAPVAIANRRIICIDGPTGSGKSLSLDVLASSTDTRVVSVKLNDSHTHKGVVEELCKAIEPGVAVFEGYTRDLMAHLRARTSNADLVIMIDEAQKAPMRALELVRELHEHPTSRFGLVLAGVDIRRKVGREPMLKSRVGLCIPYARLHGDALVTFLRQMSPVWESYDAGLLQDTDDLSCQGDLRQWVILAEWVRSMTGNGTTTPTPEHLRQAVDFLGDSIDELF